MIYFLVISCQKNKYKLLYHREFIKQNWQEMAKNDVRFVFVMGGKPDHSIPGVIFLDCEDTYEHLPKKVYQGFKYIVDNKPDVEAIVKIDDDVQMNGYCLKMARFFSWIPYWGVKLGHLFEEDTVYIEYYSRFSKLHLPMIPLKKCIHALGYTYFLNKTSIEIVLNNGEEMYKGYHEDAIVGRILNNHNIFPVDLGFRLGDHFRL